MNCEYNNSNSPQGIHDRQDSYKQKKQLQNQNKSDSKVLTKKQIRKENNRLAAQKSRDRKQIHLEFLQKQNRILKQIINNCNQCSHKRQRYTQSSDNQIKEIIPYKENRQNQESMIQVEVYFGRSKQVEKKNRGFLRFEDQSSQNLSKFLSFCLIAALLCIAHISKQKYMEDSTRRLQFDSLNSHVQKNVSDKTMNQKKEQRSLTDIKVKQCKKCVQCFQNITNNSSSSLVSRVGNDTEFNQTKNITSSLNKIILCKSKAAFFKRIYKALESSDNNSSLKIRNVGKIQINGKQILELIEKDCMTDIQFNQKKTYTVEFSLAIIQLAQMKQEKRNLFQNISIQDEVIFNVTN